MSLQRPAIVAHRGLSATLPENTLPAFRAAVDAGADGVETDVQRTSDGHLVLFHDRTLARTTDVGAVFPDRVDATVGEFTLAELRRLDAGGWKGARWAGTPVPTVEELLTVLAGSRVRLFLEFKWPDLYPGIERDVVATLDGHEMLGHGGRVKFESFDVSSLVAVRRLLPAVEVGLACNERPASLADVAWATSVNVPFGQIDPQLVAEARAHGLEVTAWTVDDPDLIAKYADLGVATLTTNRADIAVEALDARERRG